MSDKNELNKTVTKESLELKKQRQEAEKKRIFKTKIIAIRFMMLIMIFSLIGVVGYIKTVHGKDWEKNAVIQQTTQTIEQTIDAPRGDILDRNGKLFATTQSYFTVFLDITVINDVDDKAHNDKLKTAVATNMESILGIPQADTLAYFAKSSDGALEKPTNYKVIKVDVSYDLANKIKDLKLSGVHLIQTYKRVYPYKSVAAQTIGFIRGDGGTDNWGLENYYDSTLTGTSGRYFTSYDGNNDVSNNQIEPIKGNSLVTTLDLTMQQFCDQLVAKYAILHNAPNASIIIMNPNDGEILAMSEYPGFDDNDPGNISLVNDPGFKARYDALPKDDPKKGEMMYKLWKNFNVSDTFEPGSIYKPLVVSAAFEENMLSPTDIFICDGYKNFKNGSKTTRIKCWIYDGTGGGHGRQTIDQVLAHSCNVGMMQLGAKIGRDIYAKYQSEFGYGSKTGIDLPGEEDAHDLIYKVSKINEIELATGSFGQGFNATALQDIVAFSSVINGGYMYKPYIVSQIIDSKNNVIKHTEPEVLKKVISKATSDTVRNDLKEVVAPGGTGAKLAIPGYSIGGKTGTAEQSVRGSSNYAISFVGFIPADNPQYIAIGVIDRPPDYNKAHTSAVPMMKELFQKMIEYYNIPADKDINVQDAEVKQIFMPNYVGKSIVEAMSDINNKNYNFTIVGSGDKVKTQMPAADSPISDNANVFLYLEESNGETNLVAVPDLTGMDMATSQKTLDALGFKYDYVEIDSKDNSDSTTATTNSAAPTDSAVSTGDIEPTSPTPLESNVIVTSQMPKTGVKISAGAEIRVILGKH